MFKYHLHILLLAVGFCASAQLRVEPAQHEFTPAASGNPSSLRIGANLPITLPFFEDFSQSTYPVATDDSLWEAGGGTFINNRYPINPPSYNVATFDGLNSQGIPYNTTLVTAVGYADALTSDAIDLQGKVLADSVYLSFFWQHSGIGELPDNQDSLTLQFKDNTGNWITVWSQAGTTAAATLTQNGFKQELIWLNNLNYYNNTFQFRFRSYGRLSGPYDVWNVDYILLDDGRNNADFYTLDWTIGNASVSFLKKYTAMHFQHFFKDKANLIDTMRFSVNNLSNTASLYDYTVTYQNNQGTILNSDNVGFDLSTTPLINAKYKPTLGGLTDINEPQDVVQIFKLNQNDTSSVLFGKNNTFITSTLLFNFYAYDDGTAEYGIGANQIGAKVSNRYILNSKDTLTDIDIMFTRNRGPNMNGRTIWASVWDKDFNLLTEQAVQVAYGGFQRYHLNTPIVIDSGNYYYVGYRQNFVELLTVGYDRNADRADEVYFNTSGTFQAYNTTIGYTPGAMMIRPIFYDPQFPALTPVQDPDTSFEYSFYPNPCQDQLHLKGLIHKALIMDIYGRSLVENSFTPAQEDKNLSLESLSDGLYILVLSNGQTTHTEKFIVKR